MTTSKTTPPTKPCLVSRASAIAVGILSLVLISPIKAEVITVMDATHQNGAFNSPSVSGYNDGVAPTFWTVSDASSRAAWAGVAGPGLGGIDGGQFFYWANPFANTLTQNNLYTVASAGELITASWYLGSNTGLMTDYVTINGLLVDQTNAILSQSGDVSTLGITLGGTGSYQTISYTTTSGDIGKQLGIRFNFFETFTGAGAVPYLDDVVITVATVPEPGSVVLVCAGLGVVTLLRRRRNGEEAR